MDIQHALGYYHSSVVYFPIILFVGALIADVCNYFGKTRALRIGHWLIILGLITCVPAIFTGSIAEIGFDSTNPIVAKHRFLGFMTGVSASFYAGLRISAMWWKLNIPSAFYVGLSFLLVSLILWASDYGALIHILTATG